MRLRVREHGDEVHVEVDGVAGRQQRVLQALNECRSRSLGLHAPAVGEVSIRASADRMRIRLRRSDGSPLQASAIYQCLRTALTDPGGASRSPAP